MTAGPAGGSLYGLLSLLAMYTHYTSAFVLIAQLAWLLWAHPDARRPALLANAAAAVLFLPWVPGLLDDMNSPTIDILSALQGDGFGVKRQAVEAWAVGYPFKTPHQFPGVFPAALALVGLVIAAVAGLVRHLRAWLRPEPSRTRESRSPLVSQRDGPRLRPGGGDRPVRVR